MVQAVQSQVHVQRRPAGSTVADESVRDGSLVTWERPEQLVFVEVTLGRTVNLQGYEFARVDVRMKAGVASVDEIEGAREYMRNVAAEVLDHEIAAVKQRERVREGIAPYAGRLYCVEFGMNYGVTLAQPDKGFGKADVSIFRPVPDGASIDAMIVEVSEWLSGAMREEAARIKGSVQAKGGLGF